MGCISTTPARRPSKAPAATQVLTLANDGITAAATAGTVTFGDSTLADPLTVKVTGGTWTNNSPNTLTVANSFANTSNGQTVTFAGSGNFLFLGAISESGNFNLTASGTGTLTFVGTNTYHNTTVNPGATIQVGNGGTTGTLGTGSGAGITDNGAIAYDLSGPLTQGVAISGIGTLSQIGSGTLTLSTANSFTGGSSITGSGTIALSNSAAMQYSTLTDNGTAATTLSFGSAITSATLGGLAGGANISLQNTASTPAAVTLTVGNNNASTVYSGVLSGSGSLTKIGSGTFELTGSAANTFAGNLTATAGTLLLDESNVATNFIAPTAGFTLGGATAVFNGSSSAATSQTFASLAVAAGGGAISLVSNNGNTNTLTITGTTDTRAAGGAVNFLLPTNTAVNWNPALAGGIIGPWAMITAGGTSQYATTVGGSLTGYTGTAAASAAAITDTSGTQNYELNAANGDDPAAGGVAVWANTVRYSAAGAETLDLSTATSFTLNGLMNSGGTLTVANAPSGAAGLTIGTNVNGGGTSPELVITGPGNTVISSIIADNTLGASKLTYAGTGTLTLTAANTYTGGTVVGVGGTLRIGNGGTTGSLSSTGTMLDNGALIFNSTNPSFAFGNTISGTGSVEINTPAVTTTNGLLLATGNTYAGGTTIDAGSSANLSASNGNGRLSTSSNLGVGSITVNGTLNITAASSVYNVLSGSGVINVPGAATIVNSISGFTGTLNVLTSTGGNKVAMNTFGTVDNPSSTQTIVIGSAADANATLFAQLQTFGPNVQFQLWGGTGDNESKGALRLDASPVMGPLTLEGGGNSGVVTLGNSQGPGSVSVITGVIQDGAGVAVTNGIAADGISMATSGNGGGAIELSAANTFTGPTTQSGGTGGVPLELGSSQALQFSTLTFTSTASTATVNGNYVVPLIQFDSAVASNTFVLGGLSSGGAAVGANTITLQNTAGQPIVLEVGNNNTSQTYAGILAGSGSLTKIGTGTETLSGVSTYAGTTTVSDGMLRLSNTGSNNNIPSTGSIRVAGGATFDVTGLGTSTFTLGSGAAAQSLSGASGTGNVTGNVTIAGVGAGVGGGTLMAPTGNSLAISGNLILSSNSTLAPTLASASATTPLVTVGGALTVNTNTIVNVTLGTGFGNGITYPLIGFSGLDDNSGNFSGWTVTAGPAGTVPILSDANLQLTLEYVLQTAQNNLTSYNGPTGTPGTVFGTPATWGVTVSGSSTYAGLQSQAPNQSTGGTAAANGYGPLLTADGNGNNLYGEVLAGSNSGSYTGGSPANVQMAWRNRTLQETTAGETGSPTSPTLPAGSSGLISNVLRLTGMSTAAGEPVQTDPFVLQMNYDAALLTNEAAQAAAGEVYLAWLNPNGGGLGVAQWQNAIAGNFNSPGGDVGTLGNDYQGSFADFLTAEETLNAGDFPGNPAAANLTNAELNLLMGAYGVDIDNHDAWAVLNHNSDFAVGTQTAVPEPSTLALAAFGFLGGAIALRRRFRGGMVQKELLV